MCVYTLSHKSDMNIRTCRFCPKVTTSHTVSLCGLCMCGNGVQVREILAISVQEIAKFGDSGLCMIVQVIKSDALHVPNLVCLCGNSFYVQTYSKTCCGLRGQ